MAIDVQSGKIIKIIDLSNLVVPSSRLQYLAVDYDQKGRAFM